MASTNKTPNYNLPQFLGTDKASWLGDINPSMLTIDTQMKLNETNANQAISTSENAVTLANGANTIANQALDYYNNEILNKPVTFTLGEDIDTTKNNLFNGTENGNKSLLNLFGGLNIKQLNYTSNIRLGTTSLRPLQQRTLWNFCTLHYRYDSTNRVTIPASSILYPDGRLELLFIGDLSLTDRNPTVDFNCFLNTLGWY